MKLISVLALFLVGLLPTTASSQQVWRETYLSMDDPGMNAATLPYDYLTHISLIGFNCNQATGHLYNQFNFSTSQWAAVRANATAHGIKLLTILGAGNLGTCMTVQGNAGFANEIAGLLNGSNTTLNPPGVVFDGVDLDWETGFYGGGSAAIAKFEAFLPVLRSVLGSKLIVFVGGAESEALAVAGNQFQNFDMYASESYDGPNSGANNSGQQWSWYNTATLRVDGSAGYDVGGFANAVHNRGVPYSKISAVLPWYGYLFTGCTHSEVVGCTASNTQYHYYNIRNNSTWWNSGQHLNDSRNGADYISLPATNQYVTFVDTTQIAQIVTWAKSVGLGGYGEWVLGAEYIASGTTEATHFPLSFALFTDSATVSPPINRTLGPEPGIQFSNPPTTPFCQYGEYQRAPASSFLGNCANFLKTYDIFPSIYNPDQSNQSIPLNLVNQYAVKVVWTDGNTYNGYGGYLGDSTALNVADVNFQNYYWGNYTPNVTVANFQSKTGVTVTPSNPLYISGDAWFTTYATWGANVNGVRQTPVTWAAGYPQNQAAWSAGWQAFITAAKNQAPNIRLVPHIASQDPIAWTNFHTIYQDCPALEKEHLPLRGANSPIQDASHRLQVYNAIQNFYWFANVAAPVFPNIATEPRTRMTQWGTDIDQSVDADVHTALAFYLMARGPNSFFDLISTGNTSANQNLWLPTAQALGTVSSSGAPQVTVIAPNHVVGDGFNLITRQYPSGIAYYNLTGTVQHPVPPAGAKDWTGNPVTSLTLADGQGEVLLTGAAPPPLAQKSIVGGIVNGAIVQ